MLKRISWTLWRKRSLLLFCLFSARHATRYSGFTGANEDTVIVTVAQGGEETLGVGQLGLRKVVGGCGRVWEGDVPRIRPRNEENLINEEPDASDVNSPSVP